MTFDLAIAFALPVVAGIFLGALIPHLRVPYSNPQEIAGVLSALRFNPATNTMRYLCFVLIPPVLMLAFLWKHYVQALTGERLSLPAREVGKLSSYWPVAALLVSWLSMMWAYDCVYGFDPYYMHALDAGETIAPGMVYARTHAVWTRIFFIHGAYSDVFHTLLAWKWFGRSLGAIQILNFCLVMAVRAALGICILGIAYSLVSDFPRREVATLVGWFILLVLLKAYFIPDWTKINQVLLSDFEILFRLPLDPKVPIIDQGLLDLVFVGRDLVFLLGVGALGLAIGSRRLWLWGLAGAIVPLCVFQSIDRGAYLCLGSVAVLLAGSGFQPSLKGRWAQELFGWILGVAMVVGLGVVWLGPHELLEGYRTTAFWVKYKDFIDSYVYPVKYLQLGSPDFNPLHRYAFPFWANLFGICFLVYRLPRYLKENRLSLARMHVLLVALAFLSYRNALGRCDIKHVYYSAPFTFLSTVFAVWLGLQECRPAVRTWAFRVSMGICGLVFLMSWVQIFRNGDRLSSVGHRVEVMRTIADDKLVDKKLLEALPAVKEAMANEKCAFILPPEPLWYYLIDRLPCSRFYITEWAAPKDFQSQLIEDLRREQPGHFLARRDYLDEDKIPVTLRFPRLWSYLQDNYRIEKSVGVYDIWRRMR